MRHLQEFRTEVFTDMDQAFRVETDHTRLLPGGMITFNKLHNSVAEEYISMLSSAQRHVFSTNNQLILFNHPYIQQTTWLPFHPQP